MAAGVEESELASKPVHTVEAGSDDLLCFSAGVLIERVPKAARLRVAASVLWP